ncbi:hypothetical protein [Thermococcus peptonophilus]
MADEGTFPPIGAELVYQDPVGNVHSLPLGNLVTINSVPPQSL